MKAEIRTTIPGPRGQELLKLKERYAAPSFAHVSAVVVDRAEYPATVIDVDGNRFIDFAAGIGALNLGHNHPEVTAAARAQLDKAAHLGFHLVLYEPYLRLAEALDGIYPGGAATKTIFVNSGAEATENAMKVARAATGREYIIAFQNSYHGRTILALTATGKTKPSRFPFMRSMSPNVIHVPYPYEYRAPVALTGDALGEFYLKLLQNTLDSNVSPEQVAGIIVEPIQGEGGFVIPPANFIRGLREICDRHGIMLIADEVQTGFCRTGRWFACDHFGITPDLMCLSKSLGAGFPLGAVTGKAAIMDAVPIWGVGSTFGGHPVACAAALKMIEVMARDNIAQRAEAVGAQIRARFDAWAARYEAIGQVRGIGAMQAFEMVKDRQSRAPNPEAVLAIQNECYNHGLITIRAGQFANVIRTLVPLTIGDAELTEGLDILEAAVARAVGQQGG